MTYMIPTPPRRVWLRAFWLTVVGMAGLTLAVLRTMLGPHPIWLLAAATILVFLIAGTASRKIRQLAYLAWARGANKYARVASRLITRLCFFIIAVAGRAGSRMQMREPGGSANDRVSGWIQKIGCPDRSTYRSQHTSSDGAEKWTRATVSWARDSGNLWFVALIPYLAVLRRVETRQARSLGGNIYTLY